MKKLNAFFVLLMVCNFVACKKDSSQSLDNSLTSTSVDEFSIPRQKSMQTIYGLEYMNGGVNRTENKLDIAGLKLARNQLMLSIKTSGGFIDRYIGDNYNVQINLNWANTAMGPVAYPVDTNQIRERAEAFFQYYQPYKDQIPVVVVENEWDNTAFHKGQISDYLAELSIITEVGHKYGFMIADAGLSSTNLRRWTYSQLSGDDALNWKNNYFVGDRLDSYDSVIETVNEYATGVDNIPIDYLNVHWYNIDSCYYGFETAANAYLKACNKQKIMTNEFGIKLSSDSLFSNTLDELDGIACFAIAYSGIGGNGNAAMLTNSMLELFKNY